MLALLPLLLIGAVALWVIVKYNSLITARNQVTNAWKGIDVQLPTTDNPDKKPENASQKLLTVSWGTPPQYYFEADQLSKQDLQKHLDELRKRLERLPPPAD